MKMPAKTRRPKRRTSLAAEVEAWSMVFEVGTDYFGDLVEFGFEAGCEGDAAIQAAARKAWRRLGAAYMRTRIPDRNREQPWALEQFGEP
jgi:hypothetical protein